MTQPADQNSSDDQPIGKAIQTSILWLAMTAFTVLPLAASAIPFPSEESKLRRAKEQAELRAKAHVIAEARTIKTIIVLTESRTEDQKSAQTNHLQVIKPIGSDSTSRNLSTENRFIVNIPSSPFGVLRTCQRIVPKPWRRSDANHWCSQWQWTHQPMPVGERNTEMIKPPQGSVAKYWLIPLKQSDEPSQRMKRRPIYKAIDVEIAATSGDKQEDPPVAWHAALELATNNSESTNPMKCFEDPICLLLQTAQLKTTGTHRNPQQILLAGRLTKQRSQRILNNPSSTPEIMGIRILNSEALSNNDNRINKNPDKIDSTNSIDPQPTLIPFNAANHLGNGEFVYLSCTANSATPEECTLDRIGTEPALSTTKPSWWPVQ